MIQNRIVFITGRKGCGKTSFANGLARELVKRKKRVVILAPMSGFDLLGCPIWHKRSDLTVDNTRRSFIMEPDTDDGAAATMQWAYICGDLWLIVDEVDMYCSPYNSDENLRNIIRYGRHKGISLVAISQRPANVLRDLTAQSDAIVAFNVTEQRDIEYLSDRLPDDLVSALPRLALFDSVLYAPDGKGVLGDGNDNSTERDKPM